MGERKCSIWGWRKPFRQQEKSMEGKEMRKEEVKGKEGVEGVTKEVNVMKKTFVKKGEKIGKVRGSWKEVDLKKGVCKLPKFNLCAMCWRQMRIVVKKLTEVPICRRG